MTEPSIWSTWGPFYHREGVIYAKGAPKGGDIRLFDVRAWGFLTGEGHGAMGLDLGVARAVQNHMGETLAALLNERHPTS